MQDVRHCLIQLIPVALTLAPVQNTVNSPNAKIVRMTTPTQTDGEDDGPDETEARKPSLASRALYVCKYQILTSSEVIC